MFILQNVIIFTLEVIYYSLFMHYADKRFNIRCFITFLLANIISLFIGYGNFYSYLFYFIELSFIFRILKIKFTLYDLLFIIFSMIFKILIEFICFIILKDMMDLFVVTFLICLLKIFIITFIKNKILFVYNHLKIKWNNNNFYIRYIFNITIFIYIIASLLFMIYN